MQFYAHMLHNLCKGKTFMQDHAFFGELYPAYEGHYDDVVERMIGLGEEVNIVEINKMAVDEMSSYSEQDIGTESGLKILLEYEDAICKHIEKLCEESSECTGQLIGDIANFSEIRQYKIKQRLKA